MFVSAWCGRSSDLKFREGSESFFTSVAFKIESRRVQSWHSNFLKRLWGKCQWIPRGQSLIICSLIDFWRHQGFDGSASRHVHIGADWWRSIWVEFSWNQRPTDQDMTQGGRGDAPRSLISSSQPSKPFLIKIVKLPLCLLISNTSSSPPPLIYLFVRQPAAGSNAFRLLADSDYLLCSSAGLQITPNGFLLGVCESPSTMTFLPSVANKPMNLV